MNKQELHDRLEQLHAELQQFDAVNETDRELLLKLSNDIRGLLEERSSAGASQYRRLSERLRESVALLEASHPRITMIMGQVIDTLAKMGI